MDYCNNYNRCRQFTPPGWGTARTLAPCDRIGRSVSFRVAECRPTLSPIIVPASAGMNLAKDGNIRTNPDPCHGRNFCPPSNAQRPINVHLKMCPVPGGSGGNEQGYPPPTLKSFPEPCTPKDPYCSSCPNTCPLPRCPDGVKVERTLPIVPIRRMQESYFKMPHASVYKTDYVPVKGEPTPSYAPERVVAETSGDFEHISLTKADYRPMPVCPYKKPPWAYRKPRQENQMRMIGISCYKADYVPKQGQPSPSAKPVRFIDAELPSMTDQTVYQVEYIPRELPIPVAKLTKKQMLAEVTSHCVPFDGLTVYKRDYIPKRGKPAGSVLDKESALIRPLLPMEGTTTYKASYGPFYFDDTECIPADLYDQMYPPKNRCCDVQCYPEADRILENPPPPPMPPCGPLAAQPYCPTPYEMLCSPRVEPCVPPMSLRKETSLDGCTTISVDHNVKRECQQPIQYECPQQPCKPSY